MQYYYLTQQQHTHCNNKTQKIEIRRSSKMWQHNTDNENQHTNKYYNRQREQK